MSKSAVFSLLNQQYGYSLWNEFDPIFYRLQPEKQSNDVLAFDTPIFVCRSAQQKKEHIVGMANEDGKLYIMDTQNKEQYATNAHNNAIFDLAWRFDAMQIVTASGDHTSKLYDLGDGECREIRLFCGHTRSVKTVTFQKDDPSIFASGSRDGNIILWDIRADESNFIGKADFTIMNSHLGREANTPSKSKHKYYNSGTKSVTGLVFQNANTLVSCGAGDGMIKVWDLRKHYTVHKKEPTPKYILPYAGKTSKNGFSNLLIDNAGISLYANCLDNSIYCYNMSSYSAEPVMTYTGHQNGSFFIKSALSGDGKYLVSGSSDENAYVWNLKHSKPIVKLTGHTAEVTCVAWSSNKFTPSILTCSDDMSFRLWKVCKLDDDDSDVASRGTVEVLPPPYRIKPNRKRTLPIKDDIPLKRPSWQCQNCESITMKVNLCENCISLKSLKRKADCDLWNESKRVGTDLEPRRLFANLNGNFKDARSDQGFCILERTNNDEMCLKSLNKALECFKTSNEKKSDLTTSPTVNLPNFVLDGVAPHLNYSPPKRKAQDWLTRLRIEKNLRQEMLDRTAGQSSPKCPRLDGTPKSSKKTWVTPKSPLLRFFKVTNSPSSKSESVSSNKNLNSPKTNSNDHILQ